MGAIQGIQERRREPLGLHPRSDADECDSRLHQKPFIRHPDRPLPQDKGGLTHLHHLRLQPEQVIQPGRRAEIRLHPEHRKDETIVVELPHRKPAPPEKLRPCPLEEAKVVGMIDHPAGIGVLVIDTELHETLSTAFNCILDGEGDPLSLEIHCQDLHRHQIPHPHRVMGIFQKLLG